jgi:hypothetical protein
MHATPGAYICHRLQLAMQDRLQQTQPRKRYLKRCCACETVENQRLHRSYKKMTIVGSARFREFLIKARGRSYPTKASFF